MIMQPTSTPTLLHDILDQRAAAAPTAQALRRGNRTWSYRELAGRSDAAARWLSGLGVGRGDRIVLLGHNQIELVPLLFAASRLGAIFVLLSDRTTAYHLRHILADCTPTVVIGGPVAVDLVRASTDVDMPVHTLADAPAATTQPATDVSRPCLSVDPVCLIYTSGSTALPKAVVCTHRQVLFAALAIHSRLSYRSDDTVFCCLPLSFDYGLYQVFLCCVAGARLVLGDDGDAGPTLLRRLDAENVSVLPLVPSLAATLCRLVRRVGIAPTRLRMVTNTGADLSPARCATLRTAMPGLAVVAMFGLTECKRVSIAEPNLDLIRPGSVGRPLPDTEVSIVDEKGQPLPPGVPGELVVRGPNVMAGYWNAPELTAARYRTGKHGQPVLHTGDRCLIDDDGYLYFVGRADDIFKQHGFRVSTTEIEAAALDIPGVEAAAALPPDGEHGSRLAVCGDLTDRQVADGLVARLEEPKLPGECRVVPGLPLTVNGKVDKRTLAEQWAGVPEEAVA
ncbi:MAG TPA: AMP-binding protein [Pseudonocardiaceae bacterium]|nr:AMP-binding protein [Pseudonocardiaceae bacterium]